VKVCFAVISATQGMFALGRLVSVMLSTKFSPAFMLLCNIVRNAVMYTYVPDVGKYVNSFVFVFVVGASDSSLHYCELRRS